MQEQDLNSNSSSYYPIIWNDNPENPAPYIFYPFLTEDAEFLQECISFSKWAARKLGYPIVDVELKDENFYSCLQESYLEFNSQVLGFEASKNNALYSGLISKKNVDGSRVNMTTKNVNPVNAIGKALLSFSNSVFESPSPSLKRAKIQIEAGKQEYDLLEYIPEMIDRNNTIRILGILQQIPRSSNLIYFPGRFSSMHTTSGYYVIGSLSDYAQISMHNNMAMNMLRSHHGALIKKNRYLIIFPVPYANSTVYVEYDVKILLSDIQEAFNTIADVNYRFYPYSDLNEYSKTWIRNYGLACAKELLGLIRSKYSSIPGPGEGISLNGSDLISQGSSEKERLITQLREDLQRAIESSSIISSTIEAYQNISNNRTKGRVFLR